MGKKIQIVADEVRFRPEKSEVERLWASNTKAKSLFGWQPAYSGLDGFRRGLEETVDWFMMDQNLQGYKANLFNL
jgi:dTDP-glucose 4,6-dehydratase